MLQCNIIIDYHIFIVIVYPTPRNIYNKFEINYYKIYAQTMGDIPLIKDILEIYPDANVNEYVNNKMIDMHQCFTNKTEKEKKGI